MKQQGFTLIELIVVIVILGILAVTAAPKFVSIQSDARVAAVNGLVSSLKSARDIVRGKSIVEGEHTSASAAVSVSGTTVNTVYGDPAATSSDGLIAATDVTAVEITGSQTQSALDAADWAHFAASGVLYVAPASLFTTSSTAAAATFTATNCYVQYTAATASARAIVALQSSSGC